MRPLLSVVWCFFFLLILSNPVADFVFSSPVIVVTGAVDVQHNGAVIHIAMRNYPPDFHLCCVSSSTVAVHLYFSHLLAVHFASRAKRSVASACARLLSMQCYKNMQYATEISVRRQILLLLVGNVQTNVHSSAQTNIRALNTPFWCPYFLLYFHLALAQSRCSVVSILIVCVAVNALLIFIITIRVGTFVFGTDSMHAAHIIYLSSSSRESHITFCAV